MDVYTNLIVNFHLLINNDNFPEEIIEIIHGVKNIIDPILEKGLNLRQFADICSDHNRPTVCVIYHFSPFNN